MRELVSNRRHGIKEKTILFFLYLFTFIWWIKWGIIILPDSIGYDRMYPMRSMGYPLFIKITTLFGLIHSIFPTLFLALVIGLFSINQFVDFLKVQLNLSKLSVVLATVIFLLPNIIFFNANCDGSECIAYPLFIITLHLLLKSAFNKSEKSAVWYIISSVILILVRTQFLFLYVVSFLLVLYLVWQSASKKRSAIYLGSLLIISFLSISLLDRTYHLIVNHHFRQTEYTGSQLIVPALFNAKPGDTILFKDPIQKGLFDSVMTALKKNETYNFKFTKEYSEYTVVRYNHLYNLIQHRLVENYLGNIWIKKGLKLVDPDYWDFVEKTTTPMAIVLIKAHPVDYGKLYLCVLKSAMGDWTFLVPFIIIFIFSIIAFIAYRNKLSIFFLVSSILMFTNVALVSAIEEALTRYLFYTYFALISVVSIALLKQFESKSE